MADTQAAPQIVKALTGVLPDAAVRQLMQALGNCNQPYTSRAAQNFQPNDPFGNTNGVYGPGRWNPSDYPGLIPPTGSGPVYIPGQGGYTYNAGDYNYTAGNTSNYGGNTFNFPTSNAYNLNNYYGGPTFNVGGNSTFNNVITNNITTNQITVTGGGGGGGWPMPEQPPATPGGGGGGGGDAPGVPGGGGWGGPVLFPPAWVPPIIPPIGTIPRPPFTGTITVTMPTGGELTDDCKVKFTGYRGVGFTVSVR